MPKWSMVPLSCDRIAQAGATPEIIKVVIAHGGTIWEERTTA